jgi:tRNA dimethylallyltransferase
VARQAGDIELCSIDSMQVYRGMDIGTDKPSPAEQAEVPHHLLDLADPDHDFTVSEFQAAARAALAAIEGRGHRALLVGGTALYLRAVIDELDLPGQFPEVRTELEADPDTVGLHARLEQLDPVAAGRMEPSNRRRVVRALEVTVGSGRPFSSHGPGLDHHQPIEVDLVGVWLPKEVVARRISARYDAQVAAGFVDEVRTVVGRPGGLSRTAGQALGYRQVLDHLEGGPTLDDALAEAKRRTVRFARRQRAWFRRDPRVRWLGHADNPLALLSTLLGDWA